MPTKKSFDKLSKIHSHPRDERIVFEEIEHKYTIDGDSSGWISATSLLSKLHEPFDSNKAVEALMNGSRYKNGEHPLSGKNKPEILRYWKQENYRGTALHARMEYGMNMKGEKTIVKGIVRLDGMFQDGLYSVVKMDKSNKVYIYKKDINQSPKDLTDTEGPEGPEDPTEKQEKQEKEESEGDTELLLLGYMWNDGMIRRNSEDDSELEENEPVLTFKEAVMESFQVNHFWSNNPHLKPYRSEWMIWNREYKIAGTMDAVFEDTRDNTYWIYDWKRVQSGLDADLEATKYGYIVEDTEWLEPVQYWTKRMKGAASELYDTKYWHYCLQLNLYRYILEKDYGLKIKGMVLVQFHPSLGDAPKYHRVVFLDNPIQALLKERGEALTKNKTNTERTERTEPIETTESKGDDQDVSKLKEDLKGCDETDESNLNNIVVKSIPIRKNKGMLTPSSTIKRTIVTRSMARLMKI